MNLNEMITFFEFFQVCEDYYEVGFSKTLRGQVTLRTIVLKIWLKLRVWLTIVYAVSYDPSLREGRYECTKIEYGETKKWSLFVNSDDAEEKKKRSGYEDRRMKKKKALTYFLYGYSDYVSALS